MSSSKEFCEYINSSPKFKRIEWQDLPNNIKLKLTNFPNEIKKLGNFVTIRRLKLCNQKEDITNNIISIKKSMMGTNSFKIDFPININTKEYAQLYALMVSEGSFNTEFSLNVPEKFFHKLFKKCIKNIISDEAAHLIKSDYSKGFLRSRAPAIIRKIIPIPDQIPSLILNNKEFAREYLKISFEAEGSPIINKRQHKRYIKISRYSDITPFILHEKLPLNKRIYLNTLWREYPKLFERIKNKPPKILKGEQILLKHHFNIDGKLVLEAIRNNKTDLRTGKITARWVLLIYANNIDTFIKEIGFISKNKIQKLLQMKKIKGNNPQYFAVSVIKKISNKKGNFYRKDFIRAMEKLGYKSPSCYLWRYHRNGLIKKIRRGYYRLSKLVS